MFGYSAIPMGYPSNLQPALAMIVDINYPGASLGWQRLMNRTGFPDYSSSPQFAITPRSLNPEFTNSSNTFNTTSTSKSVDYDNDNATDTESTISTDGYTIDLSNPQMIAVEDKNSNMTKNQSNLLGLILHWDFDTVIDNIISDISGHNNDGTSNAENPAFTSGIFGQAMSFNEENDDRVRVVLDNFPSEEFSFSAWVRSTDNNGGSTIVSYRNMDRSSVLFKLARVNDLYVSINSQYTPLGGVSIGDGQWHHIVVSWARRNGMLSVYKNGVKVFSATDVGRVKPLSTIGEMNIGMDHEPWVWSGAYTGDIDDVRLYDRLLSEGEITWLASTMPLNDNQPPSTPSDLQAVAISQQESYLSWSPSTDNEFVAGYRIYRDNNLIGTTGSLKFHDTSMTPGSSHNYKVIAFDGATNDSSASVITTVNAPSSGSVMDILPPGHWYEIDNSSVWTQLGVAPDVMGSWSGGVYDSSRERLVIWGGGHMNYDGNELYAFDFNTFSWIQLTKITPIDQRIKSVKMYDDGLPTSTHTYGGLQYITATDQFFTSGGSIYGSGGCAAATWLYDFSAIPAESGWMNVSNGGGCGMVSAYDPVTSLVWYSAGSQLSTFDPLNLSDPWTQRLSGTISNFYMSAAIDPIRRKLVLLGGTGYGGIPKTKIYDISNPNAVTGGIVTTVGDTEIENSDAAGLEFDSVNNQLVAWKNGSQVYTLNIDNLEWTQVEPATTNLVTPSAASGNGTYGRFRYVPSKNVFVLVNKMTENVFVYKLSI